MRRLRPLTILGVGCLVALLTSPANAKTWYIKVDGTGDAPTIKAGIDSAAVGDTVLVAAGTYTWANQGTGSQFGMIEIARENRGFVLRSESGAGVTVLNAQLQGRVIFVAGFNDIVIEGFTIKGGQAPLFGNFTGGGIAMHLCHDTFRDLIIKNNYANFGGGVWCGGVSSPRFENCVIKNNIATRHGGGMFFINSTDVPTIINSEIRSNTSGTDGGGVYTTNNGINLVNTVIAHNVCEDEGGGVAAVGSYATTMSGCSVVQNTAAVGGGLFLLASDPLTLSNTIVAFNGGEALVLEGTSTATVGCCDVYGNSGGNSLPAGATDLGDNISFDPLFCDLSIFNYELDALSACLPGNNPNGPACGLIGSMGPGCGNVGVRRSTWGRIKTRYQN